MPELPEVEVTRLGLLPHVGGCRVEAVSWSGRRLRLPLPRKRLRAFVAGHRIETVDRRAKYLLFRLDSGAVMVIHLGMTGRIGLFPATAGRNRHDHLRLRLHTNLEMRFNDSRRFGSVEVWPPSEAGAREEEFGRHLGIEPLGPDFTPARLRDLARNRRLPVKSFLMDGRIIAGVGNIYANETLFAARIDPRTPVNRVDPDGWQRICRECPRILRAAIEAGGSSISDFLGVGSSPGYFQLQLAVYDRQGSPCTRCFTPITRVRIGGRATFFCPRCQRQGSKQAMAAL